MDLEFTIEDLEVRDPNPEVLLPFLAEMEFRTLTKRAAAQFGTEAPEIKDAAQTVSDVPVLETVSFDHAKYEQVENATQLQTWIDRIYARGHVAVDTETTGFR